MIAFPVVSESADDESTFNWIDADCSTALDFEAAAISCDEKLQSSIITVEANILNVGSFLCGKDLGPSSIELELASCLVTLESSLFDGESKAASSVDVCLRDAQSFIEHLDYGSAYRQLLEAQKSSRDPLPKNSPAIFASLALPGASSPATGHYKMDETYISSTSSQRIVKMLSKDLQRLYSQALKVDIFVGDVCKSDSGCNSILAESQLSDMTMILEALYLLLPAENVSKIHGSILVRVVENTQCFHNLRPQSRADDFDDEMLNTLQNFRFCVITVLSMAVMVFGRTSETMAHDTICQLIRQSIDFVMRLGCDHACAKEALLLSHQCVIAAVVAAKDSGRRCDVSAGPLYRDAWREHAPRLRVCAAEAVRRGFARRDARTPVPAAIRTGEFEQTLSGQACAAAAAGGLRGGAEAAWCCGGAGAGCCVSVWEGCVAGMAAVDAVRGLPGLEPVEGYAADLALAAGREVRAWLSALGEAGRPAVGVGAAREEEEAAWIGTALFLRQEMLRLAHEVGAAPDAPAHSGPRKRAARRTPSHATRKSAKPHAARQMPMATLHSTAGHSPPVPQHVLTMASS
jgi:hypothetical protein